MALDVRKWPIGVISEPRNMPWVFAVKCRLLPKPAVPKDTGLRDIICLVFRNVNGAVAMDNHADSLPNLTDRQMNFVLGIQKGLSNPMPTGRPTTALT